MVGCSSLTLKNPPLIGSVLSIKHSGYFKNGILRHPLFWRTSLPFSGQLLSLFGNANWIEHSNSRQFFDYLGLHLNLKTLDDFYRVNVEHVKGFGGSALLETLYNNSLIEALESVYPAHKWLAWKSLQNVKYGFWDNIANQKDFLDDLGRHLEFQKMDDWYKIMGKRIAEHGGYTLLTRYGHSTSKLVMSVYPNHKWISSSFDPTLGTRWGSKENQQQFLERLARHLGLKKFEDWYNVTAKQITENGGSRILDKYKGSPSKLIMSVYTDYKWDPQNFKSRASKMPPGYWENKDNRISMIEHLTKELKIEDLSDWYRVSFSQIAEIHKNMVVFAKYPLEKLLPEAYPNYEWDIISLQNHRNGASQRWLRATLQQIFPKAGSNYKLSKNNYYQKCWKIIDIQS